MNELFGNGRRVARRSAVLSLAVALLAVSAWWLFGHTLDGWLFVLYLPALMLAMLVSTGPHDISAAAGFVAQVLQTFLMLFLLVFLGHFFWRRRRSRDQTGASSR